MIDKNKTYRTRDGREVRIYAVDGIESYPVHGATKEPKGWQINAWTKEGKEWSANLGSRGDLVEADPHGILPRHRELLAAEFSAVGWASHAEETRNGLYLYLPLDIRAALIALARLDAEKSKVEG